MVVGVGVEEVEARDKWGTWEELILGGAVLRHGTESWGAVASELQTRTLYPFVYTPQACKAKYMDLQQRYYGTTTDSVWMRCGILKLVEKKMTLFYVLVLLNLSTWFDELRKKRVDELKKALEKSEDSIGSLESKLEMLKAEKGVSCNADYSSSHTESHAPFPKSEGIEYSGKNMSKDGLSADSLTQEAPASCSPHCRATVDVSAEQEEEARTVLQFPGKELFSGIEKLAKAIYSESGMTIRRKRGERKRRVCMKDSREGSVGENHLLGSPNTGVDTLCCKTSNCEEAARSSDSDDCKEYASKEGVGELTCILDSLMQNERVCVFQHRRDSQKRARYKKLVRHHMDIDMIRSRIVQSSITSAIELFRDLLLLANNAVIFYSKSTREHKCASLLRDLVTRMLHQYHTARVALPAVPSTFPADSTATLDSTPANHRKPAKGRSTQPSNNKDATEVVGVKHGIPASESGSKTQGNAAGSPQSMESSAGTKKVPVRRRGGKVERAKRRNSGLQAETLIKVRKRARAM